MLRGQGRRPDVQSVSAIEVRVLEIDQVVTDDRDSPDSVLNNGAVNMKRKSVWSLKVLLAALCSLVVTQTLEAADWPQFLGPDRTGRSPETGLVDNWPAGGLKELWRVDGGVGMSAVAVQGDIACTLIQAGASQSLLALDVKTGAKKWSTPVAKSYRNQMGNGPRATPAIADGVVYVLTGDGTLAAVKLNNGDVVWSHNVFQEHGGKPADYGMACSPLVSNGLVIVTIGSPSATVVACDAKTGETKWTAGRGETAGYSSPALLKVGGRQQLVVFAGASAFAVEPASGKRLWTYPYRTDYDCNIATPLAINGNVFISAGENHGSVLLKPSGGVSEVWKSIGTGSVLRNEWQTSILLDGHLYGFDNVGSAGPVTHLTCVNATTGERVWQELRFGKGNMIEADGKLFATTMKGEVVVIKATPDGFQELGRQNVLGRTRQAPSLSNGRLFVRDDEVIVCLDVSGSK